MPRKYEEVTEDYITIHYNNNWYAILFTGLVEIEVAQERYGLHPSKELFIPLGMLTPYAPPIEKNGIIIGYSNQVRYPLPPAMTDEIKQEMRVLLMKKRIKDLPGEIFPDLKDLIDRNSSDFTTLLTDSLLP